MEYVVAWFLGGVVAGFFVERLVEGIEHVHTFFGLAGLLGLLAAVGQLARNSDVSELLLVACGFCRLGVHDGSAGGYGCESVAGGDPGCAGRDFRSTLSSRMELAS